MRSITVFCLLSAVCAVDLGQGGDWFGPFQNLFNPSGNDRQQPTISLSSILPQTDNRNRLQLGGQQGQQQGIPGGDWFGQFRNLFNPPGNDQQQPTISLSSILPQSNNRNQQQQVSQRLPQQQQLSQLQ